MDHVIWIGGPPGAGKTTVASRLARRHGLRLYSADTRTWIHREQLAARGSDAASRWDMRTIELERERASLLAEDVAALPATPLVVAEGTPVPARAQPGLWLIPTPEWQRQELVRRGIPPDVAETYERLRGLSEAEAGAILRVDGSRTIEETVEAVEAHFGPQLAGSEAGDRRSLMREANVAIVEQIRTAASRPWHVGDPEATERDFYCECGDPACTATILTTVAAASREDRSKMVVQEHTFRVE